MEIPSAARNFRSGWRRDKRARSAANPAVTVSRVGVAMMITAVAHPVLRAAVPLAALELPRPADPARASADVPDRLERVRLDDHLAPSRRRARSVAKPLRLHAAAHRVARVLQGTTATDPLWRRVQRPRSWSHSPLARVASRPIPESS